MAEKTELTEGAGIAGKTLQDTTEIVNQGTSTLARKLSDWLDGLSWMPDWLVHWTAIVLLLLC